MNYSGGGSGKREVGKLNWGGFVWTNRALWEAKGLVLHAAALGRSATGAQKPCME